MRTTVQMRRKRHAIDWVPGYLGQVGTRAMWPNSIGSSYKSFCSRSYHFARDEITSLQIIMANWYAVQSAADTAVAGTASVTASVEYPAGTFTQIKFSGSATGSIATGASLISDACSVRIPRGAIFYIRMWYANTNGIPYTYYVGDYTNGDAMGFTTTTGQTDQTMGGTITNTVPGGGLGCYPCAIIGWTNRRSFLLMGDSRMLGYGDTPDVTGDLGAIARSVGPKYAYINGGIVSDKAASYMTNRAKAIAVSAPYVSDIILNSGINDFSGGQTASQVLASRESILTSSTFSGKRPWVTTMEPVSTGTWTGASGSGQTTASYNSSRTSVNASVRSGRRRWIEQADQVETARDSGFWQALGGVAETADGIHSNATGVARQVFSPSLLALPF